MLAEWLIQKLDAKLDLTSIDARKKDFKEFCEANPKGEFSKSLYMDVLKREIKKKGFDPRSYGLTSGKIPSFTSSGKDMRASVTPKPVADAPKVDSRSAFTPIPSQAQTQGDYPRIIKTEGGATQEELKTEASEYRIAYTATNVGVTIKAFYSTLKLKWEFLEDLTEEEKNTLGELWLPAFDKWLQGEYSMIIIPLLATLGLLSPKIKKAQRESKLHTIEKVPDRKKETQQKKQTQQKKETGIEKIPELDEDSNYDPNQDEADEEIFRASKSPV